MIIAIGMQHISRKWNVPARQPENIRKLTTISIKWCVQQETAKGDLIQKWDKNKRYIYRGCLVMKYKRKCKYCENKEGHILEQKKNLIYVTCGVCGEVIDIVGGRMAKQLKEKLKGVV